VLWPRPDEQLEGGIGYVHFDFAEIERKTREAHEKWFALVMARATNDLQRQGYEAQKRFFEPMLAAQIEMLRLVSEGCTPEFIGRVIGSHVGNIMVNAIEASTDHRAMGDEMYDAIGKAIRSLAGDVDGYFSTVVEVTGVRGGRA